MSRTQMPMEYFLQSNPTKKSYQQYFKEMLLNRFAAASYEIMCFEIVSQKM